MRKINSKFLLIFFLIALVPFVMADFTVRTELVTNAVCPSNTILIQDIVTSMNNAPYSISLSGPAASFATAVPPGFYLNQGQSQTIYIYVTPRSSTMPGTYNLIVNIESQGITKQLTHAIVVENCHSTSLTARESIKEICSCDETNLIFTLENKGKYLEKYEISATNNANWFTISPEKIDLLPGAKIDISANMKVPCGIQGDNEITFLVKSSNSIAQASAKTLVKVYPCYDFSIITEKNYYEICENQKVDIPISIKNTGTQDNVYQINYNGPAWTNVDKKELSVKKGELGSFNLLAAPPLRTLGEFTSTIEIMSLNGKVLKKQDIKINAIKCYDSSLKLSEEKETICNGLTASYMVLLKNIGKFTTTYDIIITGPAWATLSENKVTLEAGAEKSLSLTIAPPQDAIAQDYSITIKATDTETKISSEDSLIVTTSSLSQCYQPSITSEKDIIEVGQDNAATVSFMIENKGTKKANYDIVLTGTSTQFTQINPGAVTIEPTKSQTLYLYIAPSPEIAKGDYTATVTARLKDTTILASKTVTIRVIDTQPEKPSGEKEEKPISGVSLWDKIKNFFKNLFSIKKTESKESKTEIVVITNETEISKEPPVQELNETNQTANQTQLECHNYYWYDENNKLCGQKEFCGTYMYQGLNVFDTKEECEAAIKSVENKVKNETNETGTPSTPPAEETPKKTGAPVLVKNIPDIKINKGTTYTLDLNEYFSDPDNDALFYAAVSPLNVELRINLNVVTIKPEENFEGERKIIFYASDGKEAVPSNEITLTVGNCGESCSTSTSESEKTTEQKPAINFSELLQKYRYYIIGAAIIIVIIIILLSGLGEKIVDFFEEEVEEETETQKESKESDKKK